MQNLTEINQQYLAAISQAQDILENRNTKAYKNKVLKSEQWMKNPWESVVFLIKEDKYNKYTQGSEENIESLQPDSLLDEESLISTMSIYQRWVYLIFWKDIR